MTSYRTYSAVDAVNGESTFSAAKKHNARFADVQSWFPSTSGAAQYQAMLLASGLAGFIFTHILRSNVALSHDDGNGTAGQVLRSDGDGTTSWVNTLASNVALSHDAGNGAAGQVLQSDGDGTTSWTTINVIAAWSNKTGTFSAANNGRYSCNSGITCNLYASPSDGNEFYIRPSIGQNFETSAVTVAPNGAENIAGANENFSCDINAVYHFMSNGTDWDVAVYPIVR